MNKTTKFIGLGIAWFIGSIASKIEKEKVYQEAKDYQEQSDKPGLNIGCGPTNLGDGFINADMLYQPNVSNFTFVDINKPLPFPDKHFSSVVASHILEHVENPNEVLDELSRVGDKMFLIYPDLWNAGTYATISHRWLIIKNKNYPYGLQFVKYSPFYFWLPFSLL